MRMHENTLRPAGSHGAARDPSRNLPATPQKPILPAVEAILLENQRDFLRFLVRRLGDRDTAEDVLQQFSLRVVTRKGQVRQSESVVAWLYTVLRTTLTDHYRSQAARRRREGEFALVEALARENPEPGARDGECGCIRAVLPTLKPEYADALQRADLGAAPPHRAAQGLGISANAMRVRLHRARQALRKALLRHCESCTGCDCAVCERGRSKSDAYRSQALAAS